jgi:hypothetical protein
LCNKLIYFPNSQQLSFLCPQQWQWWQANVLQIPLPKFHNGDDAVTHIRRLAKVCVTNGEDTNAHKLQYFPTTLRGKNVSLFTHYETTNLATSWGEVQHAFISGLSDVHNER